MDLAPVISVVMPVYNGRRYLRPAIDSILQQTFTDFEFFCVDDGSTDDSPAILAEYAQRDPRVKVITKANGGVTSALIAGVNASRGEFIARMDADDMAEPQRFELQVQYLRDHPDCVACGCHILKVDGQGKVIEAGIPFTTHEEICTELWKANAGALPHFGATLRASTVKKIGGYNPQFRTAQDLELWLRLAEVGQLANIPQPLMRWRIHEGAVTVSRAEEQARNAREILRQAYARKGQKLPKSVKKWENFVVAVKRLKWGWTALEQGRYAEARSSALKVIWRQPFERYGWQLGFHAFLGPARPWLRSMVRKVKPSPRVPASELALPVGEGIATADHQVASSLIPSPGTPGEGQGDGLSSHVNEKSPHPSPLPEYRERGQELTGDPSLKGSHP